MSTATITSIESSNLVLPFEVSVISPVHVGMDTEKSYQAGIDTKTINKKIQIIDFNRVFKHLKEDKAALQSLTNSLEKQDISNVERILNRLAAGNDIVLKSFNAKHIGFRFRDIKKQFEQVNGHFLIPGSSLKGSIRSVLIKSILGGSFHFDETNVFGTIGLNLMKYIQVTDIPFNKSSLYVSKIYVADKDSSRGKWKFHNSRANPNPKHTDDINLSRFSTIYEAIPPGGSSYLELRIGTNNAELITLLKSSQLLPPNFFKIQHWNSNIVLKLLRQHTESYLQKEKVFFEKFSNDQISNFGEYISNLITINNESETSCLLRVGAGSGFHSITGDWQEKSQDHFSARGRGNQIFNKTRKIFFDENKKPHLPGFIKLTLCERKTPGERTLLFPRNVNQPPKEAPTHSIDRLESDLILTSPPAPEKPAIPENVSGPFKKNMEIPAKVVESIPGSKQVKAELCVEGGKQWVTFRYPAGIDVGTYIWIKVQDVDKKKKKVLNGSFFKLH